MANHFEMGSNSRSYLSSTKLPVKFDPTLSLIFYTFFVFYCAIMVSALDVLVLLVCHTRTPRYQITEINITNNALL